MNIIKKLHFTPELLRLAAIHYVEALGLISAIVTIIAAAVDHPLVPLKWLVIMCGIICLIYTIYRIWPTESVSIYLAPRKMVKLESGDLFSMNGIVVIPVNDYFDMTTERDVVGKNSVHGQFIKMYTEKHPDMNINEEINKTLSKDGVVMQSRNEHREFPKNFDKYELGTVARVFDEEKTYYLTVVSEFDDKNHIIHQPEKFGYIIQQMLKSINIFRSGNDVYIPVIGAGLMNMPMRIDEMIEFILDNIKFCNDYNSSVGCIHIVVRKQDMDKVSFRVIQNHKSSIFNKLYQ